jgi:uncharacterized protein YecE (DUF72 family)
VQVWLGTSGWQYRDWRGRFYPADLPQARWLEHYARHFRTVEVNNSFYRLPAATTFEGWARRTPDDFVFVVKASRYLTHVKRLTDSEPAVDLFMDRARALGPKLGPVLGQLPPNLQVSADRLAAVLERFSAHGARVAVEPRHPTWFVDEVYEVLGRYGAALSLTDRHNRRGPIVPTADWTYLRMHEGTAHPHPRYGDRALASWVDAIRSQPVQEVWVFFNNDPGGWAVANARTFGRLAERAGLDVTRFPAEPVRVAHAS